MLVYPRQLDRTRLLQADVVDLTAAITTYINATGLPPRDLVPREIEYRHLAMPMGFKLGQEFGLTRVGTSVTFGTSNLAGWVPLNQSFLYHAATVASAPNGSTANRPTVQVHGALRASNVVYDATVATQFCIGTSSDGGVTWDPVLDTLRPLGWSGGYVRQIYDVLTQPHYWTGAAGYVPMNVPLDREVTSLASFGGEVSHGDPTTFQAYCVMINSLFVAASDYLSGYIFLTARDNGL